MLICFFFGEIETTNLDHKIEVGGRGRSQEPFPTKARLPCLKNPVVAFPGAYCCAKGLR